MHSDVGSASGSRNNNDASDVLGKILRESQESFKLPGSPGITITYTKKIDDDEVEILKEFSPSPEKGAIVGTSASTSKSFQGSCPLCQVHFDDQNVLETHASTCDGPTHTQVKRSRTFFVFKSTFSFCYLFLHSQKERTWLSSSARLILASDNRNQGANQLLAEALSPCIMWSLTYKGLGWCYLGKDNSSILNIAPGTLCGLIQPLKSSYVWSCDCDWKLLIIQSSASLKRLWELSSLIYTKSENNTSLLP